MVLDSFLNGYNFQVSPIYIIFFHH